MLQNEQLLIKKQADYLFQYLNPSVLSIFIAISLYMFLLWDFTAIRESLLKWYFINLFILSVRSITNVLYQGKLIRLQPLSWIYLYILGACLNGILITLLIFIIPEQNTLYFTYIFLLLGLMLVAAITTLGVMLQAYFAYLTTIAIPVIIFYINFFNEQYLNHLYGYTLLALFSTLSVIRFNRSLLNAFNLELTNLQLISQLDQETGIRIHA